MKNYLVRLVAKFVPFVSFFLFFFFLSLCMQHVGCVLDSSVRVYRPKITECLSNVAID